MNNQKNNSTDGIDIDALGPKIAAWGIVAMIFYLAFIDK